MEIVISCRRCSHTLGESVLLFLSAILSLSSHIVGILFRVEAHNTPHSSEDPRAPSRIHTLSYILPDAHTHGHPPPLSYTHTPSRPLCIHTPLCACFLTYLHAHGQSSSPSTNHPVAPDKLSRLGKGCLLLLLSHPSICCEASIGVRTRQQS